MISSDTEKLLRRLLTEQPVYKPDQSTLNKIHKITMLCFVGATSMGKTTIMQILEQQNADFGITKNFTSRQPRTEDDPKRYTYFEHSDTGLKPILSRIASRELLQYNIHPYSLHVYGSEVEGYSHKFNMGDIFYSSIDGFRQLGFQKLYVFSVITEPEAWRARFEQRFPAGHAHRQARLAEAISSIKWSLAQNADDHIWIVNRDGDADKAARSVLNLINGIRPSQDEARQLAEECLEKIRELCA